MIPRLSRRLGSKTPLQPGVKKIHEQLKAPPLKIQCFSTILEFFLSEICRLEELFLFFLLPIQHLEHHTAWLEDLFEYSNNFHIPVY
jgi:hypothetical protein